MFEQESKKWGNLSSLTRHTVYEEAADYSREAQRKKVVKHAPNDFTEQENRMWRSLKIEQDMRDRHEPPKLRAKEICHTGY